jgi:hypothetical protein
MVISEFKKMWSESTNSRFYHEIFEPIPMEHMPLLHFIMRSSLEKEFNQKLLKIFAYDPELLSEEDEDQRSAIQVIEESCNDPKVLKIVKNKREQVNLIQNTTQGNRAAPRNISHKEPLMDQVTRGQ